VCPVPNLFTRCGGRGGARKRWVIGGGKEKGGVEDARMGNLRFGIKNVKKGTELKKPKQPSRGIPLPYVYDR